MARSLLIALMAVVAVAGPSAAQGLGALPDLETTAEPIASSSLALACNLALCDEMILGSGCKLYTLESASQPPGYELEVHDDCYRSYIDYSLYLIDWVLDRVPPRDPADPVSTTETGVSAADAPADDAASSDDPATDDDAS